MTLPFGVRGKPSCEDHSRIGADAALKTIEPRLTDLFNEIKQAPAVARHAVVLALGYPRFFPAHQATPRKTGVPFLRFQPSDMAWINNLIKRLNAEIAAAADGVTYVDTYIAFASHENLPAGPWTSIADRPMGRQVQTGGSVCRLRMCVHRPACARITPGTGKCRSEGL